jgi:hypothetical protein
MKWSQFMKDGFLVHQQTQIKVHLLPIHPLNVNLGQVNEFIRHLRPKIVAIQMVISMFLAQAPKILIPSRTAEMPDAADSFERKKIVADDVSTALQIVSKNKTFDLENQDYIDDFIRISHENDSVVKFLDIPLHEYTTPTSIKTTELLGHVKNKYRLSKPVHSATKLGDLLFKCGLLATFRENIEKKIIEDKGI